VSYSVYQFIDGENDSREAFKRTASADIIWITRRSRDSGEQQLFIKQSLPQRYVCVGCHLNSDQALRLLCLKGHVRARDLTLWRHRWQEASEFLCTKILLFGGSWATTKIAKIPQKCFLRRAINATFAKICGWHRKKQPTLNSNRTSRGLNAWINLN